MGAKLGYEVAAHVAIADTAGQAFDVLLNQLGQVLGVRMVEHGWAFGKGHGADQAGARLGWRTN